MRSLLGLVSLLLLLVPRIGSAQAAWGQQPSARLSLLPEATMGAAPGMGVSAGARDPMGARIGAEVLLGSLLGAGGLLGGGLVGIAVAESVTCGVDDCLDGLGYVGAGVVAGIALTAPIGVYIAGHFAEGEGQFLPTLAGSLAGGGVTALTLAAISRPVSGVGVLALVVSPLVGSIVGYEVSHAFVSRERRNAAGSDVQVLPTAGVTPSGTSVFGLVGRF